MVISSFSPNSDMFNTQSYVEDRAFIFKLLLMLEDKCEWFATHFKSIVMDMEKIKANFLTLICGDSHALNGRNFRVK